MKLNKNAFGLAAGIICGVGVFLATIILLIKGGEGEHISLLRNFYPGYSFSFLGSIVGLVWGFVEGFIIGWLHGPQSSVAYHIPFIFFFLIKKIN